MYFESFKALGIRPEEVLDYLRKSQSDDPLLTVSEVLAKHETMLDEWAEQHLGGRVPENNKFREVVSGETIKDRPEINKVLRLMESPKIKAVKVVEPQRLSRGDLEDVGRLMKLLKHTNTLVITTRHNYIYDLRDKRDWDDLERELKRGNEYLEYTKKILNDGRLLSVSQGNYIGSIPPYGYDKAEVMDGKRKCPTLVENKAQADVVRMIFDMYVNKDMGRVNIAHTLDNLGIKPPKGKTWTQDGIKGILENVHYIGKVKWNHRKTVTIVEDGEVIKTRPENKIGEYLIYEGKHDAIVSEEIFNAAREKQGRNHRAKAATKIRNPLASLLYCQCGRAMSLRTNRKNSIEQGRARLMCDDQVHCHTGSCLYDEMIDRVCDILQQCIEDFEVRVENNEGDSVKLHANLIKSLEKKMRDLQQQELNQWELQSHPDPAKRMPQEIFQRLNEKLLKEKEEVQQALCKAYESMPEPVNYEDKVVTFTAALEALRNPEADAALQNRLLKRCIERIDYKRDKPRRITRDEAEKLGIKMAVGGKWTAPEIELDVKLRV